MKLIDFDGIFNNKMAKMIEKHAAEHTESEWEDLIADMYKKFGDTPLKELGATPRAYFGAMSESALVESLKEYLLQDISVPDFLCETLEGRDCTEPLLKLLYETDEQLVQYAINLLNTNPKAAVRYAEMLKEDAYDEHVKDSLADMLKPNADLVLEEVLALCKDKETEPYALEILSKLKNKDDRADAALMNAVLAADDREQPRLCAYLASYGDERALPVFMGTIEREDIDYVLFQELKFAIEALGGEYNKERDFSSDENYQKIMAAEAREIFPKN